MSVDPSIASLIGWYLIILNLYNCLNIYLIHVARELFEGCIFTTTHIKAVTKNELLSDEEKKICLRRLYIAITAGILGKYTNINKTN